MRIKLISLIATVFAIGTLTAQPKLVDRAAEKKEYPDLQFTEGEHDKNIQQAYARIRMYSPLVNMAAKDRANSFKEKAEPLRFENTFRFIKFTPRNTYIRFVKESADFMLVGLGETKTLQALINDKIEAAKKAGVNVPAFQFQNRDGIELTQFQFILRADSDKTRAIGSRRKTVMLFYKAGAAATPDSEADMPLDLVVTRVVEDDYDAGVKDVELIIDPSPETPGTDDMITLHRYNYKVTDCAIIGAMSNTPNYPHRVEFKQKFYGRLLDHFDTLYRMVDTYAKRDGNGANEKSIQRMRASMDY